MKRSFYCFLWILTLLGCEDVIEVEVPEEPPRLIVDALIRIDVSQSFQLVQVRVGLTDSFFGQIPPATVEQITITNVDMPSTFENPNSIVLLESEPGVYERGKNTDFFTTGELVLQIDYEGQRYLARTRFVPTVPIDSLRQGDGTLFEGDETEVVVQFTDADSRDDYYLFDFDFDEYLVTEDEFYQGQQFTFSYFYDNNLEPGREVEIKILGVDEPFYNYMDQLIEQSGDFQGPFQTPSATVRGNIINVTDIDNIDAFDNVDKPDNFALGYFAVSQEFRRTITIE